MYLNLNAGILLMKRSLSICSGFERTTTLRVQYGIFLCMWLGVMKIQATTILLQNILEL